MGAQNIERKLPVRAINMEEESSENSEILGKQIEDGMHKSLLPWDLFSNWLHCACVVTFDLELGQAMEVLHIFKLTFLLFFKRC